MPHWPIYTGATKQINNANVVRVLDLLGNPHQKLQNVIHINGTNGKGSMASFCHQILMQHGYSCTKYTSPHLLACNERIVFNNTPISDEELYLFAEQIRLLCEENRIEITIFETTTIAAFLFFASKDPQFNVIEVGMGGLNDATNVFAEEQIVGVILGTISLDHTKFLGPTLESIAAHKLAIAKQSAPLVCSPQQFDIANLIDYYCAQNNITPIFYGKDFEVITIENDPDNFCLQYLGQQYILPYPSLQGPHQLFNLASAVVCLLNIEGLELNYQALHEAIKNTKWAGRLEKITKPHLTNLLPPKSEIIFDGAHNEGGAQALANYIATLDASIPNYIIIGRSKETDSAIFAKHLAKPEVSGLVAVRSCGEVRPEMEHIIYGQIVNSPHTNYFNKTNTFCKQNLVEALQFINTISHHAYCRVFICGSLYMARDIHILSPLWI